MRNFFVKYGIRFGAAILVTAATEPLFNSQWNWLAFIGRAIATIGVVWLTYPMESWLNSRKLAKR